MQTGLHDCAGCLPVSHLCRSISSLSTWICNVLGKIGWVAVLPLNTEIVWAIATLAQECLLRRGPEAMALVSSSPWPLFYKGWDQFPRAQIEIGLSQRESSPKRSPEIPLALFDQVTSCGSISLSPLSTWHREDAKKCFLKE